MNDNALVEVIKSDSFLYILGAEGIILAKTEYIWYQVIILSMMLVTAFARSYVKYKYRLNGKGGEKVESLQEEASGSNGSSGS